MQLLIELRWSRERMIGRLVQTLIDAARSAGQNRHGHVARKDHLAVASGTVVPGKRRYILHANPGHVGPLPCIVHVLTEHCLLNGVK